MSIQSGKSRLFHSGQNTQNLSVKGYLSTKRKSKALIKHIQTSNLNEESLQFIITGDLIRSTSSSLALSKNLLSWVNSPKTINPELNLPEDHSRTCTEAGLD